jgi:cation diffusion facilitator family transporter
MKQIKPEVGAWVSIGSYFVLSSVKLFVGYWANSQALKADGLNNFTDIISSIAILIGLLIAKKPRDENHPYGHSRAEHISSLLAAFIMMTIGMEVLIDAVLALGSDKKMVPDAIAAWTAFFAACFMFFVYLFNKKLAERTNSQAIAAAAKDHLSDALVSIGTVIGIMGTYIGVIWLDSLTALIVGLIICKTAWDIFKEASHTLTDGFDEEKLRQYKQEISEIPGVEQVTEVKARMLGNEVILDVTIQVSPHLNVVKSHEIADCIEVFMQEKHDVTKTHVHIEPYSTLDEKTH